MLNELIQRNWEFDIEGYAQKLQIPLGEDFPAWTVHFKEGYGVAIPYDGSDDINESFASAKIRSMTINFKSGETRNAIVLITNSETIKIPFASLCEALVDPGEKGERRESIETDPVSWWKEWKELLGNKNIDDRIYDVLGELCVLKYAVDNNEDAEWNGPEGASYDIETHDRFIEVKSSINREKREVTISNQFQLDPPNKKLDLILCQFEPTIFSGISIESIIYDFKKLGYNIDTLNSKLELLGLEIGMSARKRTFILHDMLLYSVDESFPRITPASFIEGVMPKGIIKISYTVDLSGRTAFSLMQGDNQNV
jgi:hypothetical protein